MTRYFFHIVDGERYDDLQGTVLPDLTSARREAIRFASALLADREEIFWSSSEWTMRVTDEHDLTLFELHFMATDSPAATRHDETRTTDRAKPDPTART